MITLELLSKILWFLAGGVILLYATLYLVQNYLLFHPRRLQTHILKWIAQTYPHSELTITTTNGIQLHGWLIKPISQEKPPLVIYFGGNAEEVSGMAYHAERFDGWAVLLINYQGYGLSEGKPTEKNLLSDALAIFDAITQHQDIDIQNVVAMGRSLGSGVAVHLAAHRPVTGVILVTPYDSITQVAQRYFPFVPVALLLKHPFNSLALAPSITKPMLAIVGPQDTLIPPTHAYRLVKNWAGAYEIKSIENTNHENISDTEIYWETIRDFLARVYSNPK